MPSAQRPPKATTTSTLAKQFYNLGAAVGARKNTRVLDHVSFLVEVSALQAQKRGGRADAELYGNLTRCGDCRRNLPDAVSTDVAVSLYKAQQARGSKLLAPIVWDLVGKCLGQIHIADGICSFIGTTCPRESHDLIVGAEVQSCRVLLTAARLEQPHRMPFDLLAKIPIDQIFQGLGGPWGTCRVGLLHERSAPRLAPYKPLGYELLKSRVHGMAADAEFAEQVVLCRQLTVCGIAPLKDALTQRLRNSVVTRGRIANRQHGFLAVSGGHRSACATATRRVIDVGSEIFRAGMKSIDVG